MREETFSVGIGGNAHLVAPSYTAVIFPDRAAVNRGLLGTFFVKELQLHD